MVKAVLILALFCLQDNMFGIGHGRLMLRIRLDRGHF